MKGLPSVYRGMSFFREEKQIQMTTKTENDLTTMQGDFSAVPKGFGALAVMGLDGDTKHIWDKSKPIEVEAARALFNTLVKDKKYIAFRVELDGTKGEGPIKEFDPNEERYIFSPPLQGG